MRFEKIVLHIGLGKTGSSAIQQALQRHADYLEAQVDVLVPRSFDDPRPFAGNHSIYLRSLSSDRPHELRVNRAAGLEDQGSVQKADDALRNQYDAIFSSSEAKTLVLSAEGVGHFDDASTLRLAHWLHTLSSRIEVVACVRHPRHALAAEIQQRLKTGARLERLYQNPPFYRYSELFERLAIAFGKEALQLYDYAEVVANAGGAVDTFFRKLDWALPRQQEDLGIVNAALSHEATLLLDSLNRQRPLMLEGKRNPLRRQGDVAVFTRIPGAVFQPPQDVYETLDTMAAPELVWLQEHYGLSLDPMSAGNDPSGFSAETELAFDPAAIDALALLLSDPV